MRNKLLLSIFFFSSFAFGSGIYNPGTGGGGGGVGGTINNANQNTVPVYSVSGSSNVLSGSSIATDNGSTFTVTGVIVGSTVEINNPALFNTLTAFGPTGLLISTSGFLTASSATATYLQNSSATATYLQLSSATATYLQSSSATLTYLNLNNAKVSTSNGLTGGGSLPVTISVSSVSLSTQVIGNLASSHVTLISSGVAFGSATNTITQDTNTFTYSTNTANGLNVNNTVSFGALSAGAYPFAWDNTNNVLVLGGGSSDTSSYQTLNTNAGIYGIHIFGNVIGLYESTNTTVQIQPLAGANSDASYQDILGIGYNGYTINSLPVNGSDSHFVPMTLKAQDTASTTHSVTVVVESTGVAISSNIYVSGTGLISGPGVSTVTFQLQVGSMTGAGLTTCGDSTHALAWSSSNNLFSCQNVTGSGGGSSSLSVGTGTASAYIFQASSPTAILNFDATTHNTQLTGSATAFISLNASSVTLQGNSNIALLNSTQTFTGGNTFTSPSGMTVTYSVAAGSGTFTNPLNSGTTAMTIINNDNTGHEDAVVVQNIGQQNAIQVIQTGNVSKSFINGGAVNLINAPAANPTAHGALLVIYSSDTAPIDNLVNIRTEPTVTFTSNVVFISGVSSQPLVSINFAGTNTDGATGGALNVTSSNPNFSAVSFSGTEGAPDGFGTMKITHTAPSNASDANASLISLQLTGNVTNSTTSSQGIFMKSTATNGTTGKLLNIRNPNTERLVLNSAGTLILSPSTSSAGNPYILFMSTTPGLTQDNVTIAVSTNGEIVVNGSTGTSGQFLTSQGPGSAVKWTTGGGGGSSSLSVGTGTVSSYVFQASSPTAILNFDGSTIKTQLAGSATAFVSLNPSSVTLQGALPTQLGTVTQGVWTGTTIAIANGGTNGTSFTNPKLTYFNGTSLVSDTNGNAFASSETFTGANGIGVNFNVSAGSITDNSSTAHGVALGNKPITYTLAGAQGAPLVGAGGSADPAFTNVLGSNTQAIQITSNTILGSTTMYYGGILLGASINANELTGTLQSGQFPALTGDVTTPGASLVTTAAANQPNIFTLNSTSITITGQSLHNATATFVSNSSAIYDIFVASASAGSVGISTHVFVSTQGVVYVNQLKGAGLVASCGDSTHGLSWNSATNNFGCQSITGSGSGSGITSPSTFTWISTSPWGIQLSTLNVIGSNLGVNVVQVSTNNTSTFAMSISSVGATAFQDTVSSAGAFIINNVNGSPALTVSSTGGFTTGDIILNVQASTVASYALAVTTATTGLNELTISTGGQLHVNSGLYLSTASSNGTATIVNATYQMQPYDTVILASATAAGYNITLATASYDVGQVIDIVKVSNDSFTITVITTGTDLIDGTTRQLTLNAIGQQDELISLGNVFGTGIWQAHGHGLEPTPLIERTCMGEANNTGSIGTSSNTYVMGVEVRDHVSISTMMVNVNTAAGNMDIGIYDAKGTLLTHTGVVAVPAQGTDTEAIPRVSLAPGYYYFGITVGNTVATIGRCSTVNTTPTCKSFTGTSSTLASSINTSGASGGSFGNQCFNLWGLVDGGSTF